MKKILISDSVDEKCTAILKTAGFEADLITNLSREDLLELIPEYHALIVRSSTQVDSELITKMENIEVIGRAGAGVDNIDIAAATRKGILVMNTPGGNTISAAEHTMALMLAMSRKIPQANISLHLKKWDRNKFQGTELSGKTLGLIGLGKIGREVAIRAKAFGVKIIVHDPIISNDVISELNLKSVTLDDIWKNSDIISVHVPLNDRTKNLVSYDELARCKDGVAIINCARGGIVNEKALLKALKEGKVSGAGLDVFESEPPDFSSGLVQHPAVVSTPHLGASTEEAQKKVAIQIAEQVVDYFNSGTITGAVNTSMLKELTTDYLKSFLKLSEVLGKILSQVRRGSLKKISISYTGEQIHGYTKLFSTALLKGFLSEELDDAVNFINANLLANEKGILLEETISTDSKEYYNLIEATLTTDSDYWQFTGTVFGGNEIRIVNVNKYSVEFKPEGNLLLYRNIDKPGMLTAVSKQLSSANLNIAGLSLGRLTEGEHALTVISTDSSIEEDLKNSISSIEGIKDIYSVYI